MSPKKSINFQRRPFRSSIAFAFASAPTKRAQSLPPFFLTKKLRKSIERLLPAEHHKRLRLYFDTYGCIRCSHNDVLYCANGLCGRCLRTINKRLAKVDIQLQATVPNHPEHLEEAYLRPYRSARRLLADLVPKVSRRSTQGKPTPKSPPKVYLKWLA